MVVKELKVDFSARRKTNYIVQDEVIKISGSLRLKIVSEDRVGMTMDVLKVLWRNRVSFQAMNVEPGIGYIKIPKDQQADVEQLRDLIANERGVIEVDEIPLLPLEKRERDIQAVLDAATEGIIAIDIDGKITQLNTAAEDILGLRAEDVLGMPLGQVLTADFPLLKTVKTGKSYDNEEIHIDTNKVSSNIITSGRPILDERGNPIGAVATMLAVSQVMDLIYSVTKPITITFDEIIGESSEIRQVKKLARLAAKGDSTVLIRGESGTGKELFARAIHMASLRADKRFVAVNCAALPETLLESELFGYEEGAFTGAKRGGRTGLFKYADQGTIFLDEIGEISYYMQAKLLRVLQEGSIRRVGSNKETPVDVRIIAATNRNLEEMIENRQFREDLYYRLNVIPIVVPPLRARKDDIPILANHFLNKISAKMNKPVTGISSEAMDKLLAYDWPGNIRELANVMERAVNLCEGQIQAEDLIISEDELYSFIEATAIDDPPKTSGLKDLVANIEKQAIAAALSKNQSLRKTAKALRISHSTLLYKMNMYGIRR